MTPGSRVMCSATVTTFLTMVPALIPPSSGIYCYTGSGVDVTASLMAVQCANGITSCKNVTRRKLALEVKQLTTDPKKRVQISQTTRILILFSKLVLEGILFLNPL